MAPPTKLLSQNLRFVWVPLSGSQGIELFPYPLDSKAYEHKWVIFPALMKTNKAKHVSDSNCLENAYPHFTNDVGPRLIFYLGKTSQMAEVGMEAYSDNGGFMLPTLLVRTTPLES